MTLSRDEAAKALKEIGEARERSTKLRGYQYGAPYVMLWGFVWLIANSVTNFDRELGNLAWGICVGSAFLISIFLGFSQGRDNKRMTAEEKAQHTRIGIRATGTSIIMIAGMYGVFWILAPFEQRQFNAAFSLIWMCLYMVGGLWQGWRVFAIGAVAAAAIVFGYLRIHDNFDLWMGVVGGGALILGGLWMRKA